MMEENATSKANVGCLDRSMNANMQTQIVMILMVVTSSFKMGCKIIEGGM